MLYLKFLENKYTYTLRKVGSNIAGEDICTAIGINSKFWFNFISEHNRPTQLTKAKEHQKTPGRAGQAIQEVSTNKLLELKICTQVYFRLPSNFH